MSGGVWGYQIQKIEEKATEVHDLLRSVALTEQMVDRAEAGDTNREQAKNQLYDLWVETFDRVYGR